MTISIFILVLIVTALLKLPYYRMGEINKFVFPSIFLLKAICAALVWWYFYDKPGYGAESDLYQFYNVANHLQEKLSWWEEFKVAFGLPVPKSCLAVLQNTEYWYKLYDYGMINDNRMMIRINLVLNWIVGNSFFCHALIFTFLGFSGSFYLFQTVRLFRAKNLYVYATILFLLPSNLVWTGGMFKESTLIFTLGGSIYYFTRIFIMSAARPFDYLWFLLFAILMLQTKPLFSIAFLYSFICIYVHSKFKFPQFKMSYLLTFLLPIILFTSVISLNHYNPKDQEIRQGIRFSLPSFLKNKQEDFYYDVRIFKPKTVVSLKRIDGTYNSILTSIPYALKNVLISPIILSFEKWEMIPFALELVLLFSFILLRLFYPYTENNRMNNTFFSLMITSLLCLLFLGLTIPISGLIVKYASPVIPILFMFSAAHLDWDKIKFMISKKLVRSK
jgi:hypothetical protein